MGLELWPTSGLLLAWSLWVALVACGLYWSLAILRILRTTRRVPHVRTGMTIPSPPGGWPTVSIVVPVHNEERVIDRCLRSLRGQDHPDLQVIVVLDRCTDGTAEIVRRHAAEDRRVIAIENASCPPDWAGKCNAARLGAARATGEWLLFIDADVRLDPTLVRSAQAIAHRDRLALLSLVGRLTTAHRFERIAQPAASMTLLRMFPLERVTHPRTPRSFANGQFMLFRRSDYDAVGGHHRVRDDLLEDLAFARTVRQSGRDIAVLIADDMLEVSMYDSFAAFRAGWRRILIEACSRKVGRLRLNALRVAASGVLPVLLATVAAVRFVAVGPALGSVVEIAVAASVAFALIAQALALALVYRRVGLPMAWLVGYPIGALIVARECLGGASDLAHARPIRWGGRAYVIAPR